MDDKNCYGIIYCSTNKINGKMYIGQTTKNLKERKLSHERDAIKNKEKDDIVYFQKAINKYGPDSFSWKIIDRGYSKNELNFLEQYYIDFLSTSIKSNGYNLAMGGQFGSVNYEVREQMSKSGKNRYIKNPEERNNISKRFKERNPNCCWITNGEEDHFILKDEFCQYEEKGYSLGRRKGLFTKNRKGKVYICKLLEDGTYETKCMYLQEAEFYLENGWKRGCGFNKNPSKERRKKASEQRKGRPSYNKGKSPSEETRLKISKTLSGRTVNEEIKNKISNTLKGKRGTPRVLKANRTKAINKIIKQNNLAIDSIFSNINNYIFEELKNNEKKTCRKFSS